MKVKAVKNYYDKLLKRIVNTNEELEVAENRGNVLLKAKVAVDITPTTTEGVAVKKPSTRKKKEA